MNLKSGTTPTPDSSDKKRLTGLELVAILKASREARVALLQWGDLTVWFESEVVRQKDAEITRLQASLPEAAISDVQQQVAGLSFAQAELETKDEELSDLWITDPAKAEQLLREGKLDEHGLTDDIDE